MATMDVFITEGGSAVGSGWTLVYGDSGTGHKTTDANGQIHYASIPASFRACLAFCIIDDAGTLRMGGGGMYIAAGGTYTFDN